MEQHFNNEVLDKLKRKKRKKIWNRILCTLMSLVVFCTTYVLILPAITKETEVYCGIEEHTHEASCYQEALTCQIHVHTDTCYTDEDILICTEVADPDHSHTETCKDRSVICGKEEHVHSQICFSDPAADVETKETWEATLPELNGTVKQNVIAIAKSQLGYTESSDNYIVDDGGNLKGYTRYGAWYGSPYGDWNAMFAAFCLHYAGANYPYTESSSAWAEMLKEQDLFKIPSEYVPSIGDIVFFDTEGDGTVDRVGLVENIEGVNFTAVEGDNSNSVARNGYDLFNEHIVGYGVVTVLRTETETDVPETETDTEAPETEVDTEAPETETDTEAPETETDAEAPESEADAEEPETDADVPETEVDTEAPETEADTEVPETETDTGTQTEADPDDSPSVGGGAWAEIVEPAETVAEAYEEQPQVYSLRSSAPMRSSTFALRGSSSTYQATQRAAPLDLTPYINAVNMYDSKGNLIPSGSVVTEGDVIEFKIEYTVTGQQLGVLNGENITVKSDTLTYKIPAIFEVVKSDSGNIYNSSGQIVGSYVIDSETETIAMQFTETYVEQNANGMQINGFISFFSTVTKITDFDSEEQDYKFTDKITLGITIEEKDESVGDLKIEKQKTDVVGEYITYEIKVSSKEGTTGPITITDVMSKGLTFVEGISVKKNNRTNVNAEFNASSDKSSYTMTLPEMSPEDYYTIEYKCHADMDLLDADMTVRNTATVNGKDSLDGDLEDKATVEYNFDVLKKTGIDNGDGTITWTITINQAKVDISGWTLEDIITTNNGSSNYRVPVTIRNSQGNVVANNVTLPYTFRDGSNDTYTVSYTTKHSISDGETIYNKAILKDKDTEVTVVKGVGVGSPFTKSGQLGELIVDENGINLMPITWTVTIDTSNGPIAAGSTLNDSLYGEYNTADVYVTYEQLMDAIATIRAALESVGSGIRTVSAVSFAPSYAYGSKYNMNALENNAECKTLTYESFDIVLSKDIPEGKTVTFSYESYGVFLNNFVEDSEFKNSFSLEGQYRIEASVKYSSGIIKVTKYGMYLYDPEGGNQDWNVHWTPDPSTDPLKYNYDQLHDSYLAWVIDFTIPTGYSSGQDIVITEDLPDGVTVKGLDFKFTHHVPARNFNSIRNMIPGNTYEWNFKLYTVDEYMGYKDPNGGTNTSITIKQTAAGDLEFTIPGEMLKTMGQYMVRYNEYYGRNDKDTTGMLYIYTQINDDFEWPQSSEDSKVYVNAFENRFTMTDENGEVLDIGSQTQIITRDEREGAIRKQAKTDDNNIINYSVILNAYGRDQIPNSRTLMVHDELTYTSTPENPLRLRLVPGSVKLYEVRVASDGSYKKLGEVTADYSYDELDTVSGNTTMWTHTIDMIVPDGKALLLEYSYKATGSKNATHDVSNSCTISGTGEGSMDGEHMLEIEVKDATAQADTKGILLYKVDADSDGIFLEKAKFNIYIWNEEQNKYIIVHHPKNGGTDFVTDANGMIVLDTSTMATDQFAYNTAYYIVEIASPEGYYLGPEPYYFYIVNNDTEAYPPCIPKGFTGRALVSGDIIYRQNVNRYTKIHVEKYWKDFNGEAMTVTGQKVSSVTLELWQMLEGQPDSAKLYGTYTMTPDEDGNWSLTITDLPKATRNTDGTKGTDYLYYIKEVGVGGYTLESAENNAGINSGTIKLTNRKLEGYVLPETGGVGTQAYVISGLLLILISTVFLINNHKKSRKEDSASP